MTETSSSFPIVREAVASFPDRDHFHRAVSSLLAAGFEASDLSVLASHDSLATASEPDGAEPRVVPAGFSDEIKYIAPLTAAGIILLSGGPIAASVAAPVSAARRWRSCSTITPRPGTGRLRCGAPRGSGPPEGALREFRTGADSDAYPRSGGRQPPHVHGRPPRPAERGS